MKRLPVEKTTSKPPARGKSHLPLQIPRVISHLVSGVLKSALKNDPKSPGEPLTCPPGNNPSPFDQISSEGLTILTNPILVGL